MAEITRLSGCSNWLKLDFVKRERTPSELMKLGIRLHLAGLSLSNTISELEKFGVKRSRKAVHDWVQKADLQPASDVSPDHIALDETVIQLNDDQYWLYAAVDPETNKLLYTSLEPTTNTGLAEVFLAESGCSGCARSPKPLALVDLHLSEQVCECHGHHTLWPAHCSNSLN